MNKISSCWKFDWKQKMPLRLILRLHDYNIKLRLYKHYMTMALQLSFF